MHILNYWRRLQHLGKKLHLWIRKINEDGGLDCFPKLHKYAASNELVVSQNLLSLFTEHLSKLSEWFAKYFAEENVQKFAWIQDPFHTQASSEFTSQ